MSQTFTNGHALIIGVGGDLPNTVEDATRLANILKDPERCAYPPEHVHLLTGKQATRDGILAKLSALAQATDAESTVVVYFSGHGYQVISTMGESYYLLPYGYRVTRLYKTAISGSDFAAKLRAIPAQKVLLLLDCCHAGGVGEAKTPELEMSKAPLPPEALALLNEGRGRVVIASSREDELSYGGRPVSVFTQAMIESLCGVGVAKKDGNVRVADIALHARQVVPKRTKDKQHPILHFSDADNFVLAYYAGGDKQPKGLPFASPPQIEPEPGAWTLSGYFAGPVALGGGDANDFRGSQSTVYKPSGSVYVSTIHGGRGFTIGDHSRVEIHESAPRDVTPPPPEPPEPKSFVNVWYTPRQYKWYQIRNPDIGTLLVDSESAKYKGEKEQLILTDIISVLHTKHWGDVNNNWVKVEYGDRENPKVAYFADAKRLGIGFLVGGSQDIFEAFHELVK